MTKKASEAFRTISEVAEWLGVSTHVLRFWEGKFSQIKPVKRAGGRRYYRPTDMQLLGGIKVLLHEDGLTIKGVQKVLREQGVKAVSARSKPLSTEEQPGAAPEAIFSAPAPTRKGAPVAETVPQKTPDRLPLFSERKLPKRIEVAIPEVSEKQPEAHPASEAAHLPSTENLTSPSDALSPEVSQKHRSLTDSKTDEEVSSPDRAPQRIFSVTGIDVNLPPDGPAIRASRVDAAHDSATPEMEAPDAAPAPKIAPEPEAPLPLVEQLRRLRPGHVPQHLLRPLNDRPMALHARMEATDDAG